MVALFRRLFRPPHFALIAALLIGMFLRTYQPAARFLYTHDNDLASWIVKDIVFDGHIRLVGQQTSAPGIFIGPLFYYLIIPFYALTQFDPVGSLLFSHLVGLCSIVSFYWVFSRLHGRSTGSLAALLYASSWSLAATEREVVPTTPVILWTVWFYYVINLLFTRTRPRTALLITAVLFALVWHLNLALVLLAPLVILAVVIHLSRYRIADFVRPAVVFFVLSLPLFIFELRHDFIQTRALVGSLTQVHTSSAPSSFWAKLNHVVQYGAKNATRIFYPSYPSDFSVYYLPVILLAALIGLFVFRKIPRYILPLYLLWGLFYLLFFTAHPINLSEYYLNGANLIWVAIAALFLSTLARAGSFARGFVAVLIAGLVFTNLFQFITSPINASGYLERRSLAAFIAADARTHHYPCVSVSYITHPGYELGYRYFFYREHLHVNQPRSGSPVYSIVFPHSLVDRLDVTFGALGLILPDYSRYTPDQVAVSCSGANSNLTDPMFGFTN